MLVLFSRYAEILRNALDKPITRLLALYSTIRSYGSRACSGTPPQQTRTLSLQLNAFYLDDFETLAQPAGQQLEARTARSRNVAIHVAERT